MMKGSMSTDLGIITINPEVIAKYAGSMAIELHTLYMHP